MKNIHFSDFTEYLRFLGLPAPEHPLFCVAAISSENNTPEDSSYQNNASQNSSSQKNKAKHNSEESTSAEQHTAENTEFVECINDGVSISSECYSISLKHIISGEIFYGRTKYDFQNGTMIFTAPHQEISTKGVKVKSTGRVIMFHEDFIRNHPIKEQINKYHYFSYAINEALHLSPKEEKMIKGLFDQIEHEYHCNHDEFSKELILSQMDTLLKYANRFYHRQFLVRKEHNSTIKDDFIKAVEAHYDESDDNYITVPSIEAIAEKLGVTPRYLTDALKVETGKTAMENLHLFLVDKAKDLLLQSDLSVASVAYQLGFEYPQYFARLFKKKVGLTPTDYRNQSH